MNNKEQATLNPEEDCHQEKLPKELRKNILEETFVMKLMEEIMEFH